ncbi:hypothetical protein JL193_08135 [Polaribacter batillariae]|uniref:Uncharacterized protein n=1 Tax=Polaribacter batillariae TaxID=2808900 RepID=A0ABX7T100_9FLAO|nr:hypothetical protein [Polaribacter batillariae]QTD39195.1 hypothetical protein JL193_08135 [Polaribacter batillariae]
MRIILTSGGESENYFDFLTGFIKTRLPILQRQFRQENPSTEVDIPELIKSFIEVNIGENVQISGGVSTIERYQNIRDKLATINVSIESIYLKNRTYYDNLTDKKRYDIEVHSRWTGHTLEELEYNQNRDNQELQNLATVIEQDGVQVVWIT